MATPQVTDLEDVVIKWAWQQFAIAREGDHKKLKFKDISFNINWDRVKFIAETPVYSDQQQLERPHSQVVFKSVYENRTDHFQEHQFQTDRSTVSSCSTNITEGFTRGFNLELKLGLPDEILSGTAGFGREVTMERSDEWTQEETVSWSINSTIKVPPHHRTVAELVVKEQEFNATFALAANIRGVVAVTLTNLRSNNSFVETVENQFCEIVRDLASSKNCKFTIQGKTVVWQVTGRCQFRYGIEQHVQLDESSI